MIKKLRSLLGLDRAEIRGRIHFLHRDSSGKVIGEFETPNLVVTVGKAAVAGLINGVVTNFFDFIAIGITNTAEAAGDTALASEIVTNGGQRAASTNTRITTTTTNDTAQLQLTYTFTGSFAVVESGIFDASSSGTLLARKTFSAINVGNGDQLTVTWKIQVS